MGVAWKAFVLLALLARTATAGNSIEFSSALEKFIGEGIVYPRLVFKDDKRPVYYQPPRDWRCTLDRNSLHLVPPNKSFAEAEISSAALEKPVALDDAAIAGLTQQILATLPPDSQQTSIVKQEHNVVLLNNNPTFELIVSYKLLGDTFERSVFVVNTPKTQILFKFSARKSDFDALYRTFHASILTWEWQPEESHDHATTP
jgi:hypothetical protein